MEKEKRISMRKLFLVDDLITSNFNQDIIVGQERIIMINISKYIKQNFV